MFLLALHSGGCGQFLVSRGSPSGLGTHTPSKQHATAEEVALVLRPGVQQPLGGHLTSFPLRKTAKRGDRLDANLLLAGSFRENPTKTS